MRTKSRLSGLAASLSYGAASEAIRRTTGTSQQSTGSLMMTEANVQRLVDKLVRMRGAALKLGQFLSIQGARPDSYSAHIPA
jgi:aarF domain-containing kinase